MFLVSCSLERSEPTASKPENSTIADLHKSTSSEVSSDSLCTVVANKSGEFDMYCGGYFVGNLYDALDSMSSKNNGACILEEIAKDDGYDVYCGGVKQGRLYNGKDGVSCNASQDSVTNEISVSCDGNLVGILHDGEDGKDGENGTSCELRDNAKGDGYDVYCGDQKEGELHNGADGATGEKGDKGENGESCSAKPSNDGVEITCGKNGIPVTLQKGAKGDKGESCTIAPASSSGHSGYNITCGNTTTPTFVQDGKDGEDGKDGADGKDGKDGAGCTLNDSNEAFVEITCGEKSTRINKDPGLYCVGKDGHYEKYNKETQMCDTRDGHAYNIGSFIGFDEQNHVWMTQNLKYNDTIANAAKNGTYSYCDGYDPSMCKDGRLYTIAAAHDSLGTASGDTTYCGKVYEGYDCPIYNFDDETYSYENCTKEGLKHFQEYELCDDYVTSHGDIVRGVCPSGWHLPTQGEFPSDDNSFNSSLTMGNVHIICNNNGNTTEEFNKGVVTDKDNYTILLWGTVGDAQLIYAYKYSYSSGDFLSDWMHDRLIFMNDVSDHCYVNAAPVRCVKDE